VKPTTFLVAKAAAWAAFIVALFLPFSEWQQLARWTENGVSRQGTTGSWSFFQLLDRVHYGLERSCLDAIVVAVALVTAGVLLALLLSGRGSHGASIAVAALSAGGFALAFAGAAQVALQWDEVRYAYGPAPSIAIDMGIGPWVILAATAAGGIASIVEIGWRGQRMRSATA
jgi:hypothetical protein